MVGFVEIEFELIDLAAIDRMTAIDHMAIRIKDDL
jgi:hypothetical protein